MKFKHASLEKLERLGDNNLHRKLRGRIRQIQGSYLTTNVFMALQRRYPWPKPHAAADFREHSAMIKRKTANITKLHKDYHRKH